MASHTEEELALPPEMRLRIALSHGDLRVRLAAAHLLVRKRGRLGHATIVAAVHAIERFPETGDPTPFAAPLLGRLDDEIKIEPVLGALSRLDDSVKLGLLWDAMETAPLPLLVPRWDELSLLASSQGMRLTRARYRRKIAACTPAERWTLLTARATDLEEHGHDLVESLVGERVPETEALVHALADGTYDGTLLEHFVIDLVQRRGGAEATSALLDRWARALAAHDQWVERACIDALAKVEDEGAIERVVQRLNETQSVALVRALRESFRVDALAALLAVLDDERTSDEVLREAALGAAAYPVAAAADRVEAWARAHADGALAAELAAELGVSRAIAG